MVRRIPLVLAVAALALAPLFAARADTVYLETGGVVKGTIIEEKDDCVRIKLDSGITQTIRRDEIAKIEKEVSVKAQFEKRFADARDKKSADDLAAVGAWAREKGLVAEAKKCFELAIQIEPEHAAAHEGLGLKKWEGKWVAIEEWEHLSRGLVKHKDQWVKPEDKDKLEAGLVQAPDGTWMKPEELAKRQAEEQAKKAEENEPAPKPEKVEKEKPEKATTEKPEPAKPEPPVHAGKGGALSFRVMTFNLRFEFPSDVTEGNAWAKRVPIITGAVHEAKISVLCEQEDKRVQVNDLKQALPEFEFYGKGRDGGGSEACSIAWNKSQWSACETGDFWLSDTPDVPASNTWGCKYPHKVSWAVLASAKNGKKVLFTSTHFDEHKDMVEVRRKSAKVIKDFVNKKTAGKLPTIVCGDFNAGVDEPAHAEITAPDGHLVDSWDVARKSEPSQGTVHNFTGKSGSHRIDWIIVSPQVLPQEIHIDRYNKDGRWPSDHFAVWAEVEVR